MLEIGRMELLFDMIYNVLSRFGFQVSATVFFLP